MTEEIDMDKPEEEVDNGNFPIIKFSHRIDEAIDGGRGVLTGAEMLGIMVLSIIELGVEVLHDVDAADIDDLLPDDEDDDDGVTA